VCLSRSVSFDALFPTRWRRLCSGRPAAQSFRLPNRVPAAMPCCWGSACAPSWRPGDPTSLAVACACTAVYHQACANNGVFQLFGRDHEEDTCGTCGKCAAEAQEFQVAFPPGAQREGVWCDAPACPRKAGDLSSLEACAMCFQTVLCGPCQGSFYQGVAVLCELNAQRVESSRPPVCGFCFAQFYAAEKPEFVVQHKEALEATNADGLDAFKQAAQRDTTLVSVPTPDPPPADGIAGPGNEPPPNPDGTGQAAPAGSTDAAAEDNGVTAGNGALPPGNDGLATAAAPLLEVGALVFVPQSNKAGVIVGLCEDGAALVALTSGVESFTPTAADGELITKRPPGEAQLLTHRPMDTLGRGRQYTGSNGSSNAKAGNQTFGLPTSHLLGITGYPFGFWKPGTPQAMRLGDALRMAGGATIATLNGDALLVFCGAVKCKNNAWVALVLTAVGGVQTIIAVPPGDLQHAASGDRMPAAQLMAVLQRVRLHPGVCVKRQHSLTRVAAQFNAAGLKVDQLQQRSYSCALFAWQLEADANGVDSWKLTKELVLNAPPEPVLPAPVPTAAQGEERQAQRPKRHRKAADPAPPRSPSDSPTRVLDARTRGSRGGAAGSGRGGGRGGAGANGSGRSGGPAARGGAAGGRGAGASERGTGGGGRAAARGGAAARSGRGQEVMSLDDTSSDSDPAEPSPPRAQRRRVETGAAARGASGHGPGHAAAVAEQQAPAAANAQGDAPVANNPPAPPPTQPPGPPTAPAPAFDPLHPSRAAVVGAVSHYLGVVYNSDAVKNDATGQVAALSLAFIERLIHAAPPPPPPR